MGLVKGHSENNLIDGKTLRMKLYQGDYAVGTKFVCVQSPPYSYKEGAVYMVREDRSSIRLVLDEPITNNNQHCYRRQGNGFSGVWQLFKQTINLEDWL